MTTPKLNRRYWPGGKIKRLQLILDVRGELFTMFGRKWREDGEWNHETPCSGYS
ncbi:MAG: hypothetical protein PHG64_14090 [Paludibacter sp.]|nr:hypothetical protein [Paludibacter sp.]